MYGADVQQLRDMAKTFREASDRLNRSSVKVTNGIQVAAWVGPLATKFRLTWNSQYRPDMSGAVQLLQANATALNRNAQEQSDASKVDRATPTSRGTSNPSSLTDFVRQYGPPNFTLQPLYDSPGFREWLEKVFRVWNPILDDGVKIVGALAKTTGLTYIPGTFLETLNWYYQECITKGAPAPDLSLKTVITTNYWVITHLDEAIPILYDVWMRT